MRLESLAVFTVILTNSEDASINAFSRPRILLIANTAWYLRNFRANLVYRLEAKGFSVILASAPGPEITTDFFLRRRFRPLHLSRMGRNPFLELIALARITFLLKRIRPDAVLTWTSKPNIYAAIAGRLLAIPVVPNVSGLGVVFIRGGLLRRLLGFIYQFAFGRAPVVFFQNNEDRDLFVSAGWVAPERAVRLPGSGVDLDRFTLHALPALEPFVFLFVGRLLADKGLHELVAATRQLRFDGYSFELRIAGFLDPGNPRAVSKDELDSWVRANEVKYLGRFEDVRPALADAHCVVLPSYYREGVPRSLLEAAAVGRPIITTNAPGCRDAVLAGESGFLSEVRDSRSLAECMRNMLLCSSERLAEMGRAGREYMEKSFAESRVLDTYLNYCQTLCRIDK